MAPRQAMSNRETTTNTRKQENTSNNPFLSASYMTEEEQSISVLEGAASKPKDDTLYEALLRYHEDDPETDTSHATDNQSYSIASEEDRKLPAKPKEELLRDRVFSDEVVPSGTLSPIEEPYGSPAVTDKKPAAKDDTNTTDEMKRFHSQAARIQSSSPEPPAGFHRYPPALDDDSPLDGLAHYEGKGILHHRPRLYSDSVIPFDELDFSDHESKSVGMPHVYPADSYTGVPFHGFAHPLKPSPPPAKPSPPTLKPSPPKSPPPNNITPSSHHPPPTHEKKSSFYESALEASGHDSPHALQEVASFHNPQLLEEDERLARELQEQQEAPPLANPEDELLAQELSRRLELEEMQRLEQQRSRSNSPPPVADLEQLEIMNKIRRDAERQRELEAMERLQQRSKSNSPPPVADLEQLEIMKKIQQDAQRGRSNSPPPCADLTQLEIMNKIREESERQQLEAALRESGGGRSADYVPSRPAALQQDPSVVDYLLSQQLAMEEWQHVPRQPMMRRTSSENNSTPTSGDEKPYRVSMEYYTPNPSSSISPPTIRPAPPSRSARSISAPNHSEHELLHRGSLETQNAIANGRAHVVQCQGCFGRLHAPMSYALVYCPKCHTVSPGQTYVASRNNSERGRQSKRGSGNNNTVKR